ncbi:MAG: ImmA/IrrE family metallo-endopeptidase [Verrucomicrobia bacterium]|nr:ImmA/IrrE family metallo-endopeptidase [Verrucomicrobiota bacterium]
MSDPKLIFAQRLTQARKMRGLSLRALAEKLEGRVSHNALHKYEQGQMMPDSEVLVALCDALGRKPDFFFRDSTVKLEAIEFRKRASLGAKPLEAIRESAKDFFERYREIEELLNVPAQFKNPLADSVVHEARDVDAAALKLRAAWELGLDPIPNVVALLEEQGIKVFDADAPETFEGFAGHAGETPVMVLNGKRPSDRKRLTALHELGHLALRFHDRLFSAKDQERLCHAFAGALLIPEPVFVEAFGGHREQIATRELVEMKIRFGISCQAIMMRARHLELISQSTLQRFFILWHKWGYDRNEPGAYPVPEQAERFKALVFRAAANEEISLSKGAYLMDQPLVEFREGLQLVA